MYIFSAKRAFLLVVVCLSLRKSPIFGTIFPPPYDAALLVSIAGPGFTPLRGSFSFRKFRSTFVKAICKASSICIASPRSMNAKSA